MHSNYVEICTYSVCYYSYILKVSGSISLKIDLCHVPHFSFRRSFSLFSPCLLVFPSCKTTNMKISLTSVLYLSESGKQRKKEGEKWEWDEYSYLKWQHYTNTSLSCSCLQKIKNAVSMNCGNIRCSVIVDVTQWFPTRATHTQENTFDFALLNL